MKDVLNPILSQMLPQNNLPKPLKSAPIPPVKAWYASPFSSGDIAANCLYIDATFKPALAEVIIINHINQNCDVFNASITETPKISMDKSLFSLSLSFPSSSSADGTATFGIGSVMRNAPKREMQAYIPARRRNMKGNCT